MIFEKLKGIIKNEEIAAEEIYHGIGLLYYVDLITLSEYHELMILLEA